MKGVNFYVASGERMVNGEMVTGRSGESDLGELGMRSEVGVGVKEGMVVAGDWVGWEEALNGPIGLAQECESVQRQLPTESLRQEERALFFSE